MHTYRHMLWVLLVALAVGAAATSSGGSRPATDAPRPGDTAPPAAAARRVQAAAPACADPEPAFVTDRGIRQMPEMTDPPARMPFRDPVFGRCLTRVTDRTADLAGDDRPPGLMNEYSRVQAFNADESRILVRGIDATWYLYDATALQPLGRLGFGGSVDPRWDAADPNVLYYSEETRLMAYDVRSGDQRLVREFAADAPGGPFAAVWSRYEGSPSIDGRFWGFMAQDADWNTTALLVYDQQADQVVAVRDMRGVEGAGAIDNVTISPLGTYLVADFGDSYCPRGTLGTDARPCGLMVYDRALRQGRGLLRIAGHGDLALDAGGREVFVYQDVDTDAIAMLDLADGTVTPLAPIDFSHTAQGVHVSGRALGRPGWAVVSTYNGGHPTDLTWMDDQVMLVELRAGGRIVRLAHHHSLYDERQEHDYWAEPHATANRDLTRILFTSNWGRTGTEAVEMYLIALPADWPARLP